MTWLIHIKSVWQFLSSQQNCKSVSSIIGIMALTDLKGIVSKVVMYDIWQLLAGGEETENAAIIVQKLFLGLYFATT